MQSFVPRCFCSPRRRIRPYHLYYLATIQLLLIALLTGCDQPVGSSATKTPAPTATPSDLPTFSDWRVAYMGGDGYLHAVTLDGKSDVIGPSLPLPTGIGPLNFDSAGISPNGRYLAYDCNGLQIVDVTGKTHLTVQVMYGMEATELYWSPDSTQLAFYTNGGGIISLVAAIGGTATALSTTPKDVGDLYGWLDNTHLLITEVPNQSIMDISSLDITTGHLQVIAAVPHLNFSLKLSPDRTQALLWNSPFQGEQFIPTVEVLDLTSGQVTPLPNITRITGSLFSVNSGYSSVAWKPGTQTVVVSTDYLENNDLHVYVLDLAHDSATHLVDSMYVGGWAPDNGPLVLTSSLRTMLDASPHDLNVVTALHLPRSL